MNSTLSLTLLLSTALTASLSAQFPGGNFPTNTLSLTTAGDFGATAELGGSSDLDSIADGTTAMRGGLNLRAGVRSSTFQGGASASTSVFGFGNSLTLSERGFISNADPMASGSAGTSADAPGSMSPTLGAHSVTADFSSIAAGAPATVTISWFGRATAGAGVSADIDVDGDGVADFSADASSGSMTATLAATAGMNGLSITVTTEGSAAVAADGSENYSATLSIRVREGATTTTCSFTNFGTGCGADLNGSVGSNLSLDLAISNAAADAFGFLAVGDALMTPMPLPAGNCDLLVGGRRFFGASFRTDSSGSANVSIRAPRRAMTTAFQAIVLSRASNMLQLDASNGVELICQ